MTMSAIAQPGNPDDPLSMIICNGSSISEKSFQATTIASWVDSIPAEVLMAI